MKILRKEAGWWEIDDIDNGQIKWDQPDKEGLINSLPGEDTPDKSYNGDGPADVMGDAFGKIQDEYQSSWGRNPSPEEMKAVFNFVFNGWKNSENKDEY